jgi:hypothetical protein
MSSTSLWAIRIIPVREKINSCDVNRLQKKNKNNKEQVPNTTIGKIHNEHSNAKNILILDAPVDITKCNGSGRPGKDCV